MENVRIERIEWARLTGERPRKAGCNSRLGEHGLHVRPPYCSPNNDRWR